MLFIAGNFPMQTTAPPSAVTTGTATKTMLQVLAPTTRPLTVVKWWVQFATAPTAPITCELIETGTVAATVTAHGATGVQPYASTNPAATPPVSLVQLGVSGTGYSASAEGTITATRLGDIQIIPVGVGSYTWEWSLGREWEIAPARVLRVRMTTATAISALTVVAWDE
jgi:hypothetical protein